MPKSHAAYAPEFRRQMVELVRSGRTPEDLSREFEPTAQSIWNWDRDADPALRQKSPGDLLRTIGWALPISMIGTVWIELDWP